MRLSQEAIDRLAAEYAIGTLRGRARRRFESIARGDRAVRDAIDRWQTFLTPLAERVAPVEPPARVWTAIESRLGRARPQLSDLWRSIGMLASGLAAVLAIAFLWFSPAREAQPTMVAVLTASDSVPRMVVSAHASDQLRVQVVKPWKGTEGKSLELWALTKTGPPRSLGLVDNERVTTLRISPTDARLLAANALAVSLEPSGGSSTGQPTGPVLCSGAIAATRRT